MVYLWVGSMVLRKTMVGSESEKLNKCGTWLEIDRDQVTIPFGCCLKSIISLDIILLSIIQKIIIEERK